MEDGQISDTASTAPDSSHEDKGTQKRGKDQKTRFAEFLQRCKDFFKKKKVRAKRSSKKSAPGKIKNFDESFSHPEICEIQYEEEKRRVDRLANFGREKGDFHSTWEKTSLTDLKIIRIEKTLHVETVTDLQTGQSVRADLSDIKAPKFQTSLDGMINLSELSLFSSLPFNRQALLFSTKENQIYPSQVERAHHYLGELGVYPYMALIDQLADSKILQGDDSPAFVLETEALDPNKEREGQVPLVKMIEEKIGHTHAKADGTGNKKAVNVSLLMGRTQADDPASTIILYRTHRGHLGDLLEQVLEHRLPKSGDLIFQGDLSKNNSRPIKKFKTKNWKIKIAGCGFHARRGYFRHKNDNEELCFFMLRAFALLAHIEKRIELKGGGEEITLRYRQRYSKKIWEIILKECEWVVKGDARSRGGRWPPGSKIHGACKYICTGFTELTAYLYNAKLSMGNNLSERLLRPEKLMTNNAKFKKSERGRVVFDILRTLAQTCRAAGVSYRSYMKWLHKNKKDLEENGHKYTPYEFKKFLAHQSTDRATAA